LLYIIYNAKRALHDAIPFNIGISFGPRTILEAGSI